MPRVISKTTRDLLIFHIDGPQSIPRGHKLKLQRTASAQAIFNGLLESVPMRPGWTRITDKGRAALCAALADWAEAIQQAKAAAARLSAAPQKSSESADARLAALMRADKPLKHLDKKNPPPQ